MICLLAAVIIAIAESRSSPLFVTYVDFPTCTGSVRDAACLANMAVPGYAPSYKYNVVNYAFMVPEWANPLADATGVWNNPGAYLSSSMKSQLTGSSSASNSQIRTALKKKFSDAGVKLLLAVFGGTSRPYHNFPISSIRSPGGLVDKIKDVVIGQKYDGVDIDYEGTDEFKSGVAEAWLCELTNGLRDALGSSYLITHAPQAPYLGASWGTTPSYPNGGYLGVHKNCGSKIDWYNVQFYNQGSTTYHNFQTLFTESNGWSGTTAVYQILNGVNYNGGLSIPADKLVVGKFIRQGTDGSAGWISASNMKSIFQTALGRSNPSWNTGFMTWQYIGDKESNFAWSNTVASAWDGATNPTTTRTGQQTTTTRAATTTTTSSGGGGGGSGTKIRVTMFYNSNWWMTFYLSNLGGASISTIKMKASNSAAYLNVASSWNDNNVGMVYGFSVTPSMRAPFSIKIISASGQEITGTNIIPSRAAGSSGAMPVSFNGAFTEGGDSDNDGISWAVWVAVAVCCIIIIGCIIGFIYYRKNKAKKEVTFDAKDVNEIEITDGAEVTTNT